MIDLTELISIDEIKTQLKITDQKTDEELVDYLQLGYTFIKNKLCRNLLKEERIDELFIPNKNSITFTKGESVLHLDDVTDAIKSITVNGINISDLNYHINTPPVEFSNIHFVETRTISPNEGFILIETTYDAGWELREFPSPIKDAILKAITSLYDNPSGDAPARSRALVNTYTLISPYIKQLR